jgi:hypothetical protein
LPIFITIGTGGVHDMNLPNVESFSAIGIGGFGILNIDVDNNCDGLKILKSSFI